MLVIEFNSKSFDDEAAFEGSGQGAQQARGDAGEAALDVSKAQLGVT